MTLYLRLARATQVVPRNGDALQNVLSVHRMVCAQDFAVFERERVERLLELVRACGLDLDVRVVPLDEDAWTVARRGLVLTPDERLDRAVAAVDLMREGQEIRESGDG